MGLGAKKSGKKTEGVVGRLGNLRGKDGEGMPGLLFITCPSRGAGNK